MRGSPSSRRRWLTRERMRFSSRSITSCRWLVPTSAACMESHCKSAYCKLLPFCWHWQQCLVRTTCNRRRGSNNRHHVDLK